MILLKLFRLAWSGDAKQRSLRVARLDRRIDLLHSEFAIPVAITDDDQVLQSVRQAARSEIARPDGASFEDEQRFDCSENLILLVGRVVSENSIGERVSNWYIAESDPAAQDPKVELIGFNPLDKSAVPQIADSRDWTLLEREEKPNLKDKFWPMFWIVLIVGLAGSFLLQWLLSE